MRPRWLIEAWLIVLLLWAGPAAAQGLTPAQILQQFNAVVFQGFSSTSDVEGRTVVGGNMTGGATFALNATAEAASSFAALTVYGNELSSNAMNVDSASGVVVAGNNAASYAMNSGGSVFVGGNNSGSISSNSAAANVAIAGRNTGQISLGNGGNVTIGMTNAANITINGGSSGRNGVAINGNNSGYLTLNNGGSVKINGNAGSGTLNGGSLTYTGNIGGWNLNGGASGTKVGSLSIPTPSNPLPSFSTTFQQPMVALSAQLAALTPNSTVLVNGNNVTLNAVAGANGIAVLDISTAVFQPNDSITVAMNGAKSLIINLSVAGCSSNCSYTFANSVNFQKPTSYANSVLWNLTSVNSLTFTNEFGGTVLAPTATVTNSNPIDGDLIAAAFNGTGELHDYAFTGLLPTPEPSGLAVLGVAAFGLVAVRRPRRSKLL